MLSLPTSVRILLAAEPVDMRKGFDGLSGLVRQLGQDVFDGHLYVFLSRSREQVRVLTWDRGGFVLYAKRLEKGRFRQPAVAPGSRTVKLDATELAMLLDGIDLSRVRRPQRWEPHGTGPANKGIAPRSGM